MLGGILGEHSNLGHPKLEGDAFFIFCLACNHMKTVLAVCYLEGNEKFDKIGSPASSLLQLKQN